MNEEPNELSFILLLPREIRTIIAEYTAAASLKERIRALEVHRRYRSRISSAYQRTIQYRERWLDSQRSQSGSVISPHTFMSPHEAGNNFSHILSNIYGGGSAQPEIVEQAQQRYTEMQDAEQELKDKVSRSLQEYEKRRDVHVACLQLCVVLSRVRGNTP